MPGRANTLLLSAAQLLMFGCISLLQIAPGRFFVPLLLAMHVGILLFVKLKRDSIGHRPEVARIARATYVVMAMYLPVLIYKLSDRLGLLQVHYPVLYGATLGLSVPAALLVVHSLRTMWVRGDG